MSAIVGDKQLPVFVNGVYYLIRNLVFDEEYNATFDFNGEEGVYKEIKLYLERAIRALVGSEKFQYSPADFVYEGKVFKGNKPTKEQRREWRRMCK